MLQIVTYVNYGPLLMYPQVCKSGYLVRIFSSDQPMKASWIYEFIVSSIIDLKVYLYVAQWLIMFLVIQ